MVCYSIRFFGAPNRKNAMRKIRECTVKTREKYMKVRE